mmetsp:Transcript_629/g.1133  ORF Transcript_629/g.1133 Transcript_629/m.1133 type:complete len:229 (-) Transcript_629:790-1476(-)
MHLGLPLNLLLGNFNGRSSLCGIILALIQVENLTATLGNILDLLCEVGHSEFFWISKIHRQIIISIHECMQSIHQITHILERPCLLSVTINSHGLVLQSLNYKVAHHTSVIGVHPWTERVENSCHANLHIVLLLVTVHHGLCHPLTFIITRPRANGIDITPVALLLWVFLGISVDFGSGGEEHSGLDTFGKSEHIDSSHGGSFDGFDGVVLVMWWGCRACQMVDLIYF